MTDEQKAWERQFWSNFGGREFLKLLAASIVWIFAGVGLAVLTGSAVASTVFLFAGAGPLFASQRWGPAYRVFRAIIGNPNMPAEPMPRSRVMVPVKTLPWWAFIPGIWFMLLDLLILYIILRHLSR
jgi:hypothetical protein